MEFSKSRDITTIQSIPCVIMTIKPSRPRRQVAPICQYATTGKYHKQNLHLSLSNILQKIRKSNN